MPTKRKIDKPFHKATRNTRVEKLNSIVRTNRERLRCIERMVEDGELYLDNTALDSISYLRDVINSKLARLEDEIDAIGSR